MSLMALMNFYHVSNLFFFIIQIVLKLRYVVQSKKRIVPARFYVPFISIRSRKSKLKIFHSLEVVCSGW